YRCGTPRPGLLTTSPMCACYFGASPQRRQGRPTGRGIAITADEGRASITPSNFGTGTVVTFLYTHAARSPGPIGSGVPNATNPPDEARGNHPAGAVRPVSSPSIRQTAAIAAPSKRHA